MAEAAKKKSKVIDLTDLGIEKKNKKGMFRTKILKVIPEKFDLDRECKLDMATGNGLRLTSVEAFDNKDQKIYNGLQSEFFGTDFGDQQAFEERWSCKCHRYVGSDYAGQMCQFCKTRVEFNDIDLERYGWIICDHYKFISPIFAEKLNDALGTCGNKDSVLTLILETPFDSPEQYQPRYGQADVDPTKHPFMHKGMIWLSENIEEVLRFYMTKRPTKKALFEELLSDKDKIFTHCFPVISAVLRTELPNVKNEKAYKMRINAYYKTMIRLNNAINAYDPESISEKELCIINRTLAAFHVEVLNVYDEIFKILSGKKGIIQGKVICGRMNFSARNIIGPASGILRADEVVMCYISFMELFRYEICNFYTKLMKCTIDEADKAWKKAKIKFDPSFYRIIEFMVNNYSDKLTVMINRNPSIDHGSFLMMHVVYVTPDMDNKTLIIPTSIITDQNAHFDGDMENIYRIVGADLAKAFGKTMNPRFGHAISRIDGRVNPGAMPIKDEQTLFWLFTNI